MSDFCSKRKSDTGLTFDPFNLHEVVSCLRNLFLDFHQTLEKILSQKMVCISSHLWWYGPMKSLYFFESEVTMILTEKCGWFKFLTLKMNFPNLLINRPRVNLSDRSLNKIGKELPINQFISTFLSVNTILDDINRIHKSVEKVIIISLNAVFIVLKLL